ncbi:ABC-type tungstate transport system, ATP-binding protein [Rubrivivax sp. A210]|uniref:ATP-binding cassette domain-containing protein n=1 Tax=Rubrivivax sp. A210 TaxID=2772301 RepID=UPI0019188483|nr:ATP-binding cassette domain-containing protein [Rubrivivax sp. A210]CAD5374767.1 ABC-type tungstate transport system, ATP-binding protein [Rubrivivax sp. A210]
MTDALVTLRSASVCFGATVALDSVDLALHRGDRLALVGANGSGKTTLLRLLHGLIGCEGERYATGSARGAMLFQRPFLLDLTVQWNVRLGLWLQGVAPAECAARCRGALERVGLASLAGKRARALSGGQQQRLALARAWALKPDILFLDEPTASLDPGAKREVEALITEFAADGMTMVMSTHNLGQVKRLATRAAYLEGGRLLADLPVADFFDSPRLPPQVRLFLKGELPWNT